jgi:thiamine-phosphate pyrophosphorylase
MVRRNPKELLAGGRGLYLILTSPVIPHLELARAACERGVAAIQLREKNLADDELRKLATGIADLTRDCSTLFIMNDRPDLAAECGADGVHLGRSDDAIEVARAEMPRDSLVGLSTRTPEEATAAELAGADYIGVGPIFPTGSKPDALEPIGLAGMSAVTASVPDLPKVAIGGITSETAADVMASGARYVAVIAAVCQAEDPIAAIDAFMGADEWTNLTT